jgi:hypothetical protein
LRHCQSLLFHRVSPHRLSIAPITLLKRSRLLVQRCLNSKESSKMSKSITAFFVVAVALVAAIALNPSAEKHRTKIKEAIAERSQLASVLGVGQLTAFASNYHSIWVASYTTVTGKTISVGVFGMVFVSE